MEFGDFAMMRRMLKGIKARAESVSPEPTSQLRRNGNPGAVT
jgi:hypothetical protein